MKRIKLTKGKYAIVDNEDYPYLSRFDWQTSSTETTRGVIGYGATTAINGKIIYMNRFLLKSKSNYRVSYKNGNHLDCRKKNLFYSASTDILHRCKKRVGATSKYKGVSFNKNRGKYCVAITKQRVAYYLGYFINERDAGLAYNKKAKELYGELAYQNNIK